MATKCAACGRDILDLNFLECKSCEKLYDVKCLSVTDEQFTNMAQEQKDGWCCPACIGKRKKGDNSSTPVRATHVGAGPVPLNDTYTKMDDSRVTISRGSKKSNPQPEMTKTPEVVDSLLLTEIRGLKIVVEELRGQIEAVTATLDSKIKEYLTVTTDSANLEIAQLKQTVTELEGKLEQRDQNNMANEIEIMGMPEHGGENLVHIMLTTAQKIGVELNENDIDHVVRVGPRRVQAPKYPRPVVVRFVRRLKRDQIVKSAKTRRGLTSEDIAEGMPGRVFINERLTKSNRTLFRNARLRAAERGFRFCWVRNGSIYVRRAEGQPAIRVSSTHDLDEKLFPKNSESEERTPNT